MKAKVVNFAPPHSFLELDSICLCVCYVLKGHSNEMWEYQVLNTLGKTKKISYFSGTLYKTPQFLVSRKTANNSLWIVKLLIYV